MDRPEVRRIREALQDHLDDFDLDGYDVKLGACRFDADATFKLTITPTNGESQTAADFKRCAARYGLKPSDLGQTLPDGGVVVGLKTRNKKYPILVERQGRRYKYPALMVKGLLNDAVRGCHVVGR